MPTYQQNFSIRGTEQVAMGVVVSDTYDGLSDPAILINGIIGLGTSKKDLDIDVGQQGVDQLDLSLDPQAAVTADDVAAATFILDARESASNPAKKRYVALLIDPADPVTPDDFEFRGVIEPKLSGPGTNWKDSQYGTTPDPDFTWKMTAVSIQIGDFLGEKLQDLVETIAADSTWITANVADRRGWFEVDDITNNGVDTFGYRGGFYASLANMMTVLQRLIDEATDGMLYTVTLLDSDLGLNATPSCFVGYSDVRTVWNPETQQKQQVSLDFRYGDPTHFWPDLDGKTYNNMDSNLRGSWPYAWDSSERSELSLSDIWISWRLLTPRDDARESSWLSLDTIGGLLYAIAFNLGGWIEWDFVTNTQINLRILTRHEAQISTQIYPADVTADDIELMPNDQGVAVAQFISSPHGTEGRLGSYYVDPDGAFVPGGGWKLDDKAPVMPLSISPTVGVLYTDSFDAGLEFHSEYYNAPMPHNGVFHNAPGTREHTGFIGADLSDVHTAMYMLYVAPGDDPCTGCEGQVVVRPIGLIQWLQTDENGVTTSKAAELLETYLEELGRIDRGAYRTERTLKIPFLTKFRTDPAGADDWRNLKTGTVIVLDSAEYFVVGIERDLTNATTTLRLHSTARIDIAPDPVAATADAPTAIAGLRQRGTTNKPRERFVAAEDVDMLAAVFAGPDGLVYEASADGYAYGRVIGIAVRSSASAGGLVDVQRHGMIELDADYGFSPGDRVFLRKSGTAAALVANLGREPVRHATETEYLHQQIGVMRTPTTMEIQLSRPVYLAESVPQVDFLALGAGGGV